MHNHLRNSALLFLSVIFCFKSYAKTATETIPTTKEYSIAECSINGLRPINLDNGNKIMPKHDGKNYFVDFRSNPFLADSLNPKQVKTAIQAIKDAGKKVNDILSVHLVSDLPVVISKVINGTTYDIALNKLVFTPTGNHLSVLATITTASGAFYAFEGIDVKFSGIGGIESGSLKMLVDKNTVLEDQQLSKKVSLQITGGGFTFGCNGFEDFSLFGNAIFSRELIVPESITDGAVIEGNVMSSFKIEHAKDFNDLIINISMKPFQLPSMKGYGFQVSNAIIDLSDKFNSSDFTLPRGYHPTLEGSLWKGIAMGNVAIRFPTHFKNRVSKDRISVSVKGLLIDKYGVSGEVYGENLLTFDKKKEAKNTASSNAGDLNGWDYSIEKANIVLVKNQVIAGSLNGELRMSISDEKQLLGYSAIIDPQKDYYNFSVSVSDTLEFSFLKATKVQLKKASSVSLTLADGQFDASALLHGSLNIKTGEVQIEEYNFENLFISTQAPYLKIGSFGNLKSEKTNKMGGFPISIVSTDVNVNNNIAAVSFVVKVGLDSSKISAQGGFSIQGEFTSINGRHYWKNKSFNINTLAVSGRLGVCDFDGKVDFFKDDPIYGNGFGGKMKLKMKKGINADIDIAALFGCTTQRYWFLDGLMNPQSDPDNKGLKINLMAGTFFSHMKAVPNLRSNYESVTGMTYQPDFGVGWGARFAVAMTVGSGKSMSGMAGFEIATRADGSLSKIGILGSVAIPSADANQAQVNQQYSLLCNDAEMTKPGSITTKLDQSPQEGAMAAACNSFDKVEKGPSGFAASIILKYDFDQSSFYGKIGANFKTPGGIQFQGLGAFYFAPSKWFVHLGEPPRSSRIIIGIPSFPTVEAYIMLGHGISELPNPDSEIFNEIKPQLAKRIKTNSPESLTSGRGIAFGAALSLGDKGGFPESKPIISYNVDVQAGMDIMITKMPDGTYCAGKPGEAIGFNYWRAGAQVYVIGTANASAFGINVLNTSMGALLRGSTPNPTFATGQIAVNFKLLFTKFKFNVGFKLGQECELMDGSNGEMETSELIADTFPNEGDLVENRKAMPSVTFLHDVEKPITIDGFDGRSRIKITDFKLHNKLYDQDIAGKWSVDPNNSKSVIFKPTEDLPSYKATLQATLKAKVEVLKNGVWEDVELDGKKFEQVKIVNFSVGKSSKEIINDIGTNNDNAGKVGNNATDLAQKADSVNAANLAEAARRAKASADSLAKVNSDLYADIDSTILTIPNLTDQQRKTLRDSLFTAKKSTATINKQTTVDITSIFEKAKSKVDSVSQIAVEKVKKEANELKVEVSTFVADAQKQVEELQVAWTDALKKNEDFYKSTIQGFEDAKSRAATFCNSYNWNTPEADRTKDQAIIRTLDKYVFNYSPKDYQKLVTDTQPKTQGWTDDKARAYGYCNCAVWSSYTPLAIKNEIVKQFNNNADSISKAYVGKMNDAKNIADHKSNQAIVATDLRTAEIINQATALCKQITDDASRQAKQTIDAAKAKCDEIMNKAFATCSDLVNAGKSEKDKIDFEALLKQIQTQKANEFKKEEYVTKDGVVVFDGHPVPVTTITTTPTIPDPATTTPSNTDPATTTPSNPDPTTTIPTNPDPTTTIPTNPDPTTTIPTNPDPTTTIPTNIDPTDTNPAIPDPTTTTTTNAYPGAGTVLETRACIGLTQYRAYLCAKGGGESYIKEIFDKTCPTFYSNLKWNQSGLACSFQSPDRYTYDIYVSGFEPSAIVEFSTDEGTTWNIATYSSKEFKGYVFTKSIEGLQSEKVKVLVRASDTEVMLTGDFDLCQNSSDDNNNETVVTNDNPSDNSSGTTPPGETPPSDTPSDTTPPGETPPSDTPSGTTPPDDNNTTSVDNTNTGTVDDDQEKDDSSHQDAASKAVVQQQKLNDQNEALQNESEVDRIINGTLPQQFDNTATYDTESSIALENLQKLSQQAYESKQAAKFERLTNQTNGEGLIVRPKKSTRILEDL